MPLIKSYFDPNTGLSLGQACWVVSEIETDTRQKKATALTNVYVGLAEYSGGKQPLNGDTPMRYDISGSPYANVESNLRTRAQTYIAGLAEYSGSQIV